LKVIAIIPARGGSKGIPRKNVRQLAGKPLITYTLQQARQTSALDRVIVSTDDQEIAAISEQLGAEVVWRPKEISGDTATSESALVHVLEHLRNTENYEPELVVFLQATSPLRRERDIQGAIETLKREQADSLFSAGPVHGFVWRQRADTLTPVNYDPGKRQRRQDLVETIWEENGSIYIFKPWVLKEYNSRLGGKIAVYQMDKLDSLQVDEPDDLELIETIIAGRRAPRKQKKFDLDTVRILALDFDGVMTDNRVLLDESGTEAVYCHRGDGWGIAQLAATGVEVVVLSTEKNPVVGARCQKLGIEYIQGSDDKLSALKEMVEKRSMLPDQVAFMGNDVNDLDCMKWVGMPIAVADAVNEVKEVSTVVTYRKGGRGAVREVCDLILAAKKGERHG
jgi:YrbI family 3-deoxy-D-manno-octulosonate 8-phosphate phosphatase